MSFSMCALPEILILLKPSVLSMRSPQARIVSFDTFAWPMAESMPCSAVHKSSSLVSSAPSLVVIWTLPSILMSFVSLSYEPWSALTSAERPSFW